jgi:hypothetical protein
MKKFATWRCDICDALFEFDADMVPVRCPDCLSTHDHLCRADDDVLEIDANNDYQ